MVGNINNYFILEYKTKLEAAQRQLNLAQQADEYNAKIKEFNEDLLDTDTTYQGKRGCRCSQKRPPALGLIARLYVPAPE